MTSPNIAATSSIVGKSTPMVVPSTLTPLISNTNGSNTVLKVNMLTVSNIDATTTYPVTVVFNNSNTSESFKLASSIAIPANCTLDILSKSIYLEEGQSLTISCTVASKLEAVASYEILS